MRSWGQMKMGYYATPDTVVALVKTWMRFPAAPVPVLDPCAGEGKALAQLLDGTAGVGYGIELDRDRAAEARTRLARVITGDYKSVRASVAGFALLWCNPPYDATAADEEKGTERKEKVFLRDTIHYLAPGGVVVYIIPQRRLTDDVARILAYRCEALRAWRFPDPEYEAFEQAVVLGRKKRHGLHDYAAAAALVAFARSGEAAPQLVASGGQVGYVLPEVRSDPLFRGGEIDPVQLAEEVRISPLWSRLREITGHGKARRAGRPPVPLHRGHLALLLAAGEVDGPVGSGPGRHVVCGRVRKVTTVSEEVDDDGHTTRTEHESFQVSVKLVGPDGTVRALE